MWGDRRDRWRGDPGDRESSWGKNWQMNKQPNSQARHVNQHLEINHDKPWMATNIQCWLSVQGCCCGSDGCQVCSRWAERNREGERADTQITVGEVNTHWNMHVLCVIMCSRLTFSPMHWWFSSFHGICWSQTAAFFYCIKLWTQRQIWPLVSLLVILMSYQDSVSGFMLINFQLDALLHSIII